MARFVVSGAASSAEFAQVSRVLIALSLPSVGWGDIIFFFWAI
jgi:hypothetical protein